MTKIRISIITVTYNSERFVRKTIESVLTQTYCNIEYIIVDGNSTDNTCNIIKEYQDRLAIFISEPDKNMYDAINKGIKLSTGDYICIINSDDCYVNKYVIANIVKHINKYRSYAGVYGNLIKVDASGSIIRRRRCFQVSYKELLLSKKLTFVGHGTLFISRQCIDKIGFYNSDKFNYSADYDYVLRCFRESKIKYINVDIFNFRCHNYSITSSGKISTEIQSVLENNSYYKYSSFYRFIFYYYTWIKFIILNFKYLLPRLFSLTKLIQPE